MNVNDENEKQLSGIEKRMMNLKPFGKAETLTAEERERQRTIQRNGNKASYETKKAKRTLKDTVLAMLEKSIDKETTLKLIGNSLAFLDDDNIDVQAIITACMVRSAIDGNAKAYEVLRDTSGQTVKQSLELDASVTMSDADRAMMANVERRLSANDRQNGTTKNADT